VLGGVLLGAVVFVPLFVATAVIWPSAQGPLLAFAMGLLAFVTGTVVGARSAWD